MIAISGVLVLAAIGLLASGLVLPNLWFVYASIVVSLASAVCLVVGVLVGRGQGPARGAASNKATRSKVSGGQLGGSKKKTGGSARKRSTTGRATARAGATKAGGRAATVTEDSGASVVVVPGRLRYHLASCRQVTGRDGEELDVDEAREQGYVACTACRPDSVLAARAEADDADEGADDADDADDDLAAGDAAGDDADEGSDQPDPDRDTPGAETDSATVVVVTGQRRYHLASCPVVEDAAEDDTATTETTVTEARDDGLTPCRVCGAPAP